MEEFMKCFGANIRKHRVESGFSTKYAAYVTGLSEHTIRDLERGYRNTSFKAIVQLADMMGIGIDEMIGREVKLPDA